MQVLCSTYTASVQYLCILLSTLLYTEENPHGSTYSLLRIPFEEKVQNEEDAIFLTKHREAHYASEYDRPRLMGVVWERRGILNTTTLGRPGLEGRFSRISSLQYIAIIYLQ